MLTKIIASLFLLADAYLGIRFLLNSLNILQTSKYGKGATLLYGILFAGLAIAGVYFLFFRNQQRWALWIGLGPWLLLLVIQLAVMLFSDYN
jgi:hypothetical protein